MEPCEAELGGRGERARRGLEVLKQVQRAYEEKLDLIEQQGGDSKLELQVELLRSWVSDLASQNALLADAVEELELEATSRLLAERQTHNERDSKKDRCDAVNELKILYDSLQKENVSKDREIRKLNKALQHYEQTIMSLRSEISQFKLKAEIPRKDAEVMVGFCCHGKECAEPARCDETEKFERSWFSDSFKSSGGGGGVGGGGGGARRVNAALAAEAAALRRVAGALHEQLRAAGTRARFKDDIIREMRRQLKQAKLKLKGEDSAPSQSSSRASMMAAAAAPEPAPVRSVSTGGRLRRPRAVRRESAPRLHGSDSELPDCNLDGSSGDGLVNLPN